MKGVKNKQSIRKLFAFIDSMFTVDAENRWASVLLLALVEMAKRNHLVRV